MNLNYIYLSNMYFDQNAATLRCFMNLSNSKSKHFIQQLKIVLIWTQYKVVIAAFSNKGTFSAHRNCFDLKIRTT